VYTVLDLDRVGGYRSTDSCILYVVGTGGGGGVTIAMIQPRILQSIAMLFVLKQLCYEGIYSAAGREA
jgi:hypothetical protein